MTEREIDHSELEIFNPRLIFLSCSGATTVSEQGEHRGSPLHKEKETKANTALT